jgi:hypothetical protein
MTLHLIDSILFRLIIPKIITLFMIYPLNLLLLFLTIFVKLFYSEAKPYLLKKIILHTPSILLKCLSELSLFIVFLISINAPSMKLKCLSIHKFYFSLFLLLLWISWVLLWLIYLELKILLINTLNLNAFVGGRLLFWKEIIIKIKKWTRNLVLAPMKVN